MKKINMKEYLKNHAKEIMAAGTGLLCAASFWLGCKYDNECVARGLWKFGQENPEFDSHMMAAYECMKEKYTQ